MEISGQQLNPQQIAQQIALQRARAQQPQQQMAPMMPQAMMPTDTVGLKSKAGPSNPFSPDKRLSDLKPDELAKLGGGSALETLAQAQSNLTIGEAKPLLRNPAALESIAGLMSERSDIKVSDFVSRDPKGKVQIDPSYKDPEAMEFLKTRNDVNPSEMSAMRSNLTKMFKNPAMGKKAAQKGVELMKKRTDMKPEDVTKLMGDLGGAAGLGDKGQKPGDGAGQAALDMMDSATKLLTKRSDLDPSRVGEMARGVGQLGSSKDPGKGPKVAQGFEAAVKGMEQNPLKQPEDMTKLASTLGDKMAGNDSKSGDSRFQAFATGAKMMGENNNVDAKSIGSLLDKAKTEDPNAKKKGGAGKNQALANVLDNAAAGVRKGTVSASNLNSHFKSPDSQAQIKAQKKPQGQKPQKPGEKPKPGTEGTKAQGTDATTKTSGETKASTDGKASAETKTPGAQSSGSETQTASAITGTQVNTGVQRN